MSGARGKRGRFTKGNPEAAQGGRARAATLSPERRRAIARQARAAMVRKHFGGDDGAQRAYFAALGVFNYEVQAGAFRPGSPLRTNARHPGAIQDWRASRYQLGLFDGGRIDDPRFDFFFPNAKGR